ncbi:MAG TPA: hypothetical protein VM286_03555 [Candidatus Thermoplasmatota archaeon]|nr:hypothetical protein [Candidatus Thermoplasmatota archaeon]
MRWLALAAMSLLALPWAAAAVLEGSGPPVRIEATAASDTTLYIHVGGGDFPITTRPPPDTFSADEGVGAATHSLSCIPAGTPVDGLTQHQYTTYYAFASMGPVRYEGPPTSSLGRGLAAPLALDPAHPLVLRWFMSTYSGAATELQMGDPSSEPLPVPGVVLRATVRLGERLSPFDTAYNDGAVVAMGQTAPTTLAGASTAPTPGVAAAQATPGAEVRYAGKAGDFPVYGFTLPLPVEVADVPETEGFNLRVDVFQQLPACPDPSDGYVMSNFVRVHTSPALRPRLEARQLHAIELSAQFEQFVEAQVLHVSTRSAWGRLDLDTRNATLVADPAAAFREIAAEPNPFEEPRDNLPFSQVWVWNGTLRPGTYTATYEVSNQQHTAKARATVVFEVGAKDAPGAGVGTLLAGLTGAAWVSRRAFRGRVQ